jgi:Fe-S-cluster containining protein
VNATSAGSDQRLVQLVDAALADATRRGGDWLVCRPGCSQCCHGIFQISALDAERLRDGLVQLDRHEAARAGAVRTRVQQTRALLGPFFPGDTKAGVLHDDDEAIELFEEGFADQPCPILDPASGTCDLYAARPILCRTFGPPMRNEDDGLAICELCFHGADEAEIARCEMDSGFRSLEAEAEEAYERDHPGMGRTIVAFAFGDAV